MRGNRIRPGILIRHNTESSIERERERGSSGGHANTLNMWKPRDSGACVSHERRVAPASCVTVGIARGELETLVHTVCGRLHHSATEDSGGGGDDRDPDQPIMALTVTH